MRPSGFALSRSRSSSVAVITDSSTGAVLSGPLLKTENLDGHTGPEEPRLGSDGAVYVQTLGCGIERITDIAGDAPKSNWFGLFPARSAACPPSSDIF